MAVSIEELIEMKEAVAAAKKETYDMETSIGVITVKKPTDIVRKLFDAGEMTRIAVAILDCAGYNKNIVRKVHDDAKN